MVANEFPLTGIDKVCINFLYSYESWSYRSGVRFVRTHTHTHTHTQLKYIIIKVHPSKLDIT